MNKKTIFVIILIAVIAFIIGYFVRESRKLGDLKYDIQKISLGSEAEKFKIDAEYPVFTSGIPAAAKGKINADLKNWVTDSVSKSQSDFAGLLKDPALTDSDLGLTYASKAAVTSDFSKLPYINVSLETYYYSGGAHGITDISTFVYDANTGEKVALGSVFDLSKDLYGTLSKLSLEALKEKDPNLETYSFAEDGTSANPDNFKIWTLGSDGLHIVFGDYQVGPYSSGRPEIVIPYEKLRDIVIQNSPIYVLLN